MLQHISFQDKNTEIISANILLDKDINQLKNTVNKISKYFNELIFPVSSVNGDTGDVVFNFPVNTINGLSGIVDINQNQFVTSVNGLSGIVNLKFPIYSVNNLTGNVIFNFPVSSINNLSGNVNLTLSSIVNDVGFVTSNDIPMMSVNGLSGQINLKTSNFENDIDLITSNDILVSSVNEKTGNVTFDFPVSSVNGKTGNVTFDFPVSSVNGKTGNVVLKISDLNNDKKYITINDILIKNVTSTNSIDTQVLDNKNVKIFVPNKTSQLENDSNYFNNIKNFMDINDNRQPDNKQDFLTCRLAKYSASIIYKNCTKCGDCLSVCLYNAISRDTSGIQHYVVDPLKCVSCNKCLQTCKYNAIKYQWQ